jgi:hypothetical protein
LLSMGSLGPTSETREEFDRVILYPLLLFDFVADALDAILYKAKLAGHIEGVVPHLIPGGITHLQYADETDSDSEHGPGNRKPQVSADLL